MSTQYLGENFDIHGGGADLMFPHHENEIAQSRCALPGSQFARYWVHNGFLTVNGEKMSKSLGNFITVRDLLQKGVKGEVIRLALLSAKYNEPLDWNEKLVEDAKKQLDYFYGALSKAESNNEPADISKSEWLRCLCDDLNIPAGLKQLHETASLAYKAYYDPVHAQRLLTMGRLIGILQHEPETWFKGSGGDQAVVEQINFRIAAKKAKNWAEADRIRKALADQGIILEDRPDGTTDWRRK